MDGNNLVATTAGELARRDAFHLGSTWVDPASREVRGPGGAATIEPRVMQVFLVLAAAAGAVVSRDELIRLCWNNQVVGDDALNRAVAEVRRMARTIAANEFAVETITRTGYRLTGAGIGPEIANSPAAAGGLMGRRALLAAGALTAVGAGAATWRLWPGGGRRKAADLAEQARLALIDDVPAGAARGVDLLQQATALRPEDAALWGKLALAWRAVSESGRATEVGEATKASELAAFRALGLDPRQGDARTALITLRATYGDWLAVERGLRAVLVDEPRNDAATGELAALLQSVGRSGESFTLVQAVAARQPLSPTYQYRLAFALWIQGRLGEADRVIDRAFALWPRHQAVWSTRVWLMGFTGRARVALAQIEDPETRPVRMTAPALALLQISMRAVETGLPADVKAAVDANMAAALHGPGNAVGAILVLSALHRLDEAFSVANGYLLRRGAKLMPLRTQPGQASFSDTGHRHTQVLFVPVTAPLRADPRFLPMCDECGLGEYWRRARHAPDFLAQSRSGSKP